MKKVFLKDCNIPKDKLENVIAIAVFGSYHEDCFIVNKSDIDVIILLSKKLNWNDELDIEDYLQPILSSHFSYDNIHYTFIDEFNYPFSELLLISNDKIIFKEESYLDYTLGYSTFKRDRENLEIIRNENLKSLEDIKNGLL